LNMGKFHFDKSVPEVVRAEVARFLPAHEWLVPAWCHRVNIFWKETDGEGSDAEVVTLHEYRYANLTFYGRWLAGTDEQKAQTVAHELIHVITNPLMRYVRELLEETLKEDEPKLYAHAEAHARRYYEGVVEDLARAVTERTYVAAEG
jgi:hypothetical protein